MRKLSIVLMLAIVFSFGGCGDDPEEVKNDNSSNQTSQIENSNSESNSGDHIALSTPEAPKVENQAEVLTPIVTAYCKAVNSGDNATLNKILSAATWQTYTRNAAEDGMPTVAAWLKDSEPVGNVCQVINEQLQGNVGQAIVITQTYPKGVPLKFVKENNTWRMTKESSDFDRVRGQVK